MMLNKTYFKNTISLLLLLSQSMLFCVTVISKIGQKLGFIYVFGGSFIVPYVFATI